MAATSTAFPEGSLPVDEPKPDEEQRAHSARCTGQRVQIACPFSPPRSRRIYQFMMSSGLRPSAERKPSGSGRRQAVWKSAKTLTSLSCDRNVPRRSPSWGICSPHWCSVAMIGTLRKSLLLRPTVFARFCATLVARWPNLGAGTNRRVGGVNGVFDCRHLGGVLAK
jgi:hypothetical protein